jgi:ubiquinone/menaquinone biosynthesis C-methylase UbiE
MFFPRRIPEPMVMETVELQAFEEQSFQNYQPWLIPLVDHLLEITTLKKGIVADIGCGPGLLTKEFALRSKSIKVVGVDASEIALEMARNNCEGLPNTSFESGDVKKLPFPDSAFDVVVCKDSFHHFKHPRRAMKEMLRIVKPKGVVYIQDLRRNVPGYLLKMAMPRQTVIQRLQYYSTRAAYTKSEIRALLRRFPVEQFTVSTRRVTKQLEERYSSIGMDISQLRRGFQGRWVAVLIK